MHVHESFAHVFIYKYKCVHVCVCAMCMCEFLCVYVSVCITMHFLVHKYVHVSVSVLIHNMNYNISNPLHPRYLTFQFLTLGSKDIILTVLSDSPTAKNLDRCSPAGTRPRPMQMTSLFISFLSVYSFSCPVWGKKHEDKYEHCIR